MGGRVIDDEITVGTRGRISYAFRRGRWARPRDERGTITSIEHYPSGRIRSLRVRCEESGTEIAVWRRGLLDPRCKVFRTSHDPHGDRYALRFDPGDPWPDFDPFLDDVPF